MRPAALVAGCLALGALVAGCGGNDPEDSVGATAQTAVADARALPDQTRLAELGLAIGPPENLIAACKRVARQTQLTVYCPPIVPEGRVDAPRVRRENAVVFGEDKSYGLSLQSESLIDPEDDYDPYAANHWVVAAQTPARDGPRTVDETVRYRQSEFKVRPKQFTVRGVEATLVARDAAGSGFAGSGHTIVYWRIGDTFNQASVHYNREQTAKAIARGLIVQMVKCPRAQASAPGLCAWVFPGAQ